MNTRPLANGVNGGDRGPDGKFRRGNQAAVSRSHPHAAHVAKLRSMLLQKIGPDELARIVDALVAQAEAGDCRSAELLIRYALGTPEAIDLLARLEAIEAALQSGEGTP